MLEYFDHTTCIVARTGKERDSIAEAIATGGLAIVLLDAGTADKADKDGVRPATMQRVKDLEFDRVAMVSVNDGIVPLPVALAGKGDNVERESAETEERVLVYVAATPAKKEPWVRSFGKTSEFLRNF